MTIQLRQICLVAEQLAPVIDDLTAILGIQSCFIDPGVGKFGLENNLMPVGRNFLEVVAPVQENTAAGRYLQRRQGDGGYMVITQIDTLDEHQRLRQRALDQGVRVAHEHSSDEWYLSQLHPRDMQAAFLELEWNPQADFSGYWNPVGGLGWEDKVQQGTTVDFIGVELQGADPLALAKHWASVTDLPVDTDVATPSIRFNNATLRFVEATDGRGAGLGGLDIRVSDRQAILAEARNRNCYVSDDQVNICGTRWYLHDS
ncbi:MAG: hypothetical protein CMQ44_10900 [Gammaproteobacteria bacterium]|nr:hypothetical protein [Gammaproteobacteria bacterium]|tara:strand:+ start:2209 stop:2985 length:777 start_codon:yes stop_codon:yes gene_type:complete